MSLTHYISVALDYKNQQGVRRPSLHSEAQPHTGKESPSKYSRMMATGPALPIARSCAEMQNSCRNTQKGVASQAHYKVEFRVFLICSYPLSLWILFVA